MIRLITSEWERAWTRKVFWLLLLSMPILSYLSVLYFQRHNNQTIEGNVDFATAINFPVLSLSEHLFITFNFILLLLAGFIINEEYQNGQLRLILIRSYSLSQIFLSKLVVMIGTLFLYLLTYLVSSIFLGIIYFDVPSNSLLFITGESITNEAMMFYTAYYYTLVFMTAVAMLSILVFFGVICPSLNSVLGVGFSFIFFSIAIPQLLEQSTAFAQSSTLLGIIVYSFIPKIQYTGIALLLSGWNLTLWILGILVLYIVIFIVLAYLIFTRRSYFI